MTSFYVLSLRTSTRHRAYGGDELSHEHTLIFLPRMVRFQESELLHVEGVSTLLTNSRDGTLSVHSTLIKDDREVSACQLNRDRERGGRRS